MKKFFIMILGIVVSFTHAWTMTKDSKTEVQAVTPTDGVGDDLIESMGRMAVSRKLGRNKSTRGRGSKSKLHRKNQDSVSSVKLDPAHVRQVRNNLMVETKEAKEDFPFVSARKLYFMMENYALGTLGTGRQGRVAEYQNKDMQNDAKDYLIFQLKKYIKDPRASIGFITKALSSKDQNQSLKHKVVYCMFFLLHINLVYPQQVKYGVRELDEVLRYLHGDFTRIYFDYQMVQVAVQRSMNEPNGVRIYKTNFPEIKILGTGAFDSYNNHDIYVAPSIVYKAITGYEPGQEPKVPIGAYESESESRAGHSRNQSKSIWMFTEEELAKMKEEALAAEEEAADPDEGETPESGCVFM